MNYRVVVTYPRVDTLKPLWNLKITEHNINSFSIEELYEHCAQLEDSSPTDEMIDYDRNFIIDGKYIKVLYTLYIVLEISHEVKESTLMKLENPKMVLENAYKLSMKNVSNLGDGPIKSMSRHVKLGIDAVRPCIDISPNYLEAWKYEYPKVFIELDNIIKEIETINDRVIYPSNYLRLFRIMDPKSVKVVIIGQDPYHNGAATGLAFENINTRSISPSLRNIMKVKGSDIPLGTHHVRQGVMLYNYALTVEKGKPASHIKYWEKFSYKLLKELGKQDLVWILLGNFAHRCEELVTRGKVLKASHPSPLSANRPSKNAPAFMNSNIFEKANQLLTSQNQISW